MKIMIQVEINRLGIKSNRLIGILVSLLLVVVIVLVTLRQEYTMTECEERLYKKVFGHDMPSDLREDIEGRY